MTMAAVADPRDGMTEHASVVERVRLAMEERSLTSAEVARRSGIGSGTMSQWLQGKYPGSVANVDEKLRHWLDNLEVVEELAASVPVSPGYLDLAFSSQVIATLSVAQIMPAMVMITADAGLGKTMAAERYRATRANSYLVTMGPHCRSIHNMLTEIAAALEIEQPSSSKLVRTIGTKLARVGDGTLLMVDEAQNLSDDAINQLRMFVDNYRCGVALLGNSETYTRFAQWGAGEKYGQLRRRIFKRIRRARPSLDDLDTFLKAWGISDDQQVQFLMGVGMKPGALGQIDMTVKLARMAAQGAGRDMTLADLRAAWANRDVEAA